MRRVLHLITRPKDPWLHTLLEPPPAEPETVVHIIDLTPPDPDYQALLEEIFKADSVAVW
ncbi:MAG TPA: hypothetical protein PKM73_08355 [Verrucomicrobiota bacterium]|nr:hypothetical protein [Verrucomicrobiota bacterium]HNU49559.1 hypothetical protein [Verrucomicrobiota bacterium]